MVYVESRRRDLPRQDRQVTGPTAKSSASASSCSSRKTAHPGRAEATDVTARLDGGRVAIGSRLTYNAKARRYDMRGAPLTVRQRRVDKGVTRCEETIGTTLTFDRSADTVSVVGANGAPSRTVPVPCAAGGTLP